MNQVTTIFRFSTVAKLNAVIPSLVWQGMFVYGNDQFKKYRVEKKLSLHPNLSIGSQLLPKNAAPLHIKHELQRKTKQNVDKNRLKTLTENPMPGTESFRKTRENLTE